MKKNCLGFFLDLGRKIRGKVFFFYYLYFLTLLVNTKNYFNLYFVTVTCKWTNSNDELSNQVLLSVICRIIINIFIKAQ